MIKKPENKEECNCVSFFTVRGTHKPDCPATPQTPEWQTEINTSFNIVVRAILDCIDKKITDQERDLIIETESEKGKDVIRQALSQAEERGRANLKKSIREEIAKIESDKMAKKQRDIDGEKLDEQYVYGFYKGIEKAKDEILSLKLLE